MKAFASIQESRLVLATTFRLLYVFVVLSYAHRRVVHVNVTTAPTAAWVARQLRQAFPFETVPRYLVRDRDGIYGEEVRHCLASLALPMNSSKRQDGEDR